MAMVESEQDDSGGGRRLILRPNASLSRRDARRLLFAAALVMAGIAIGFASLGLWPVLPFSGAEWLLLAYCFRLGFKASALQEVITVTEATVLLEKGRNQPEQTYRFQRAWVALDWVKSPIPGHPSSLFLRLHGKAIEIGRFLAESERERLAHELRQILRDGK
ncbi:hypothetical protein MishRS11D_04740 [Methylomagnum ishizawai]|nr:hypothetical protein MishRS11D_04740 [Methylomagnum ishizawai]